MTMFKDGIQTVPVRLRPLSGWNAALHPSQLDENELSQAYNCIYDASTGKLVTRPGAATVSSAQLAAPIQVLYPFIRSDGEGYLMAVSGGSLYRYNFSTDVWTLVTALNNSDTPTMDTFNGKLIVADGGTGLLSWDGATVSRISGSPTATIVYSARGRLICNSVSDLDAVAMCGPEDETDWDTVSGGAVVVRAGFGDGMKVNGFAMVSSTLIVSKVARSDGAVTKKKLWKLDMSVPTSNWEPDDLSENNAAIGPHCITGFGNNVYRIDSEGFESLVPTDKYGDIATDPLVGGKVNAVLGEYARQADEPKLVKLPGMAAVWIILSKSDSWTQVYTYSPMGGFTELGFAQDVRTVCEYGGKVYLGGESGYLYALQNSGTDEVSPGVEEDVVSIMRFKMITGPGDLLLVKTILQATYAWSGTYMIEVYGGDEADKRLLAQTDFVMGAANDPLHDALYELADANFSLGGGRVERTPIRSTFRGSGIMLQIRTMNGGRLSVSELAAEIAVVGG